MTGPARCELSDLPVNQCGCRIHKPGPSIADITAPGAGPRAGHFYPLTTVTTARYPGRCPECGERYGVGEPITPQRFKNIDSGTGAWAHKDCAREVSS